VKRPKEQQLDDWQRLLAMREYLGVRSQPDQAGFEPEVVEAATSKVRDIIACNARATGETINAQLAAHLGVRFEEVRSEGDIARLEKKYLQMREFGFGLISSELADPSVDAVLIQRIHASEEDADQWVAVLNLQQTEARAYWSRPHELSHRLAEPPQGRLKFYRHRTDAFNRLERIIDLSAAELAFPSVAFGPRVARVADQDLTWELIQILRQQFAPTASLLSAAKAVLRYWPQPAFLLQAKFQGRLNKPHLDKALRIQVEGRSDEAGRSQVQFFPNMRVPASSPISHSFASGQHICDCESLGLWVTSQGGRLPDRRAFTSGLNLGKVVYGIVSLL
jgi:hypothetical protein